MPAHTIPTLVKTFVAAGDLSAAQYKIMKLSADNTVTTCTGATDLPIGILQDKPDAAGKPATVMIVGISPVSADAALSVGAQYGTSADGQADAKTVGTDTTEYIIGQVLQASTAAGDHIACTVNCLNPHRAA